MGEIHGETSPEGKVKISRNALITGGANSREIYGASCESRKTRIMILAGYFIPVMILLAEVRSISILAG